MRIFQFLPFDKKKSIIEYVVLSILKECECHGYDLMKKIKEITGGAWKPSHSTIYPLLNELEEHGYVKKIEDRKGGLTRYKYSMTEKGLKYLEEQEKQLMKHYVDMVVSGIRHPIPISFLISDFGLEAIKKLSKSDQLILLKFLKDKLSNALEKINKMLEEI